MNCFDRQYFDTQIKYIERQINAMEHMIQNICNEIVRHQAEAILHGMQDRLNNLIIFSRMI